MAENIQKNSSPPQTLEDSTTKNDLGIAVIVIDAIFLGLSTFSLVVRLWSRRIQGLRLCLNDWAALLA